MRQAVIVHFRNSPGPSVEPTNAEVHHLHVGLSASESDINLADLVGRLQELDLVPDATHEDLLIVATAVYVADVRIPRDLSEDDSWTREIDLYVPVRDPELWRAAAVPLQHALQFLTGDFWHLYFDRGTVGLGIDPGDQTEYDVPLVALFSGGLDTFVGALDLVATGKPLILVGHYADGSVRVPQREAHEFVLSRAGEDQDVLLIQSRIAPPADLFEVGNDPNQRSRSFLFLAHGLLVASAAGSDALYMSENGFVSLNVPLDDLRVGTYTTRTTHPRFLALMRDVLTALNIPTTIRNPYQFKTKGEMLAECQYQDGLAQGAALTISCAHATAGRWEKGAKGSENCGRCTACLIRRAAMLRAFDSDPTEYRLENLNDATLRSDLAEGKDVRSARVAAQRVHEKPMLADILILKPGRLDGNYEAFADLYRRGMDELWQLLAEVTTTSVRAS